MYRFYHHDELEVSYFLDLPAFGCFKSKIRFNEVKWFGTGLGFWHSFQDGRRGVDSEPKKLCIFPVSEITVRSYHNYHSNTYVTGLINY